MKNFQATPSMALFPHVLTKNCRFEVNFGQKEPWFPPPPGGYLFIDQAPVHTKVRGMQPPAEKSQCEVRHSLDRSFARWRGRELRLISFSMLIQHLYRMLKCLTLQMSVSCS